MYKFLIFIIGISLVGCPFWDAYTVKSNIELSVSLSNTKFINEDDKDLNRSEKCWLIVSPNYDDTVQHHNSLPYKITSLKIIGKQMYNGEEYDTLDVLKLNSNNIASEIYLVDNSYSVLSDSIVLIYEQTNETDSSFVRKVYNMK